MKFEDDPEARIRELEQTLAETARASEAPMPGKWAAPPTPPYQAPPPSYGTMFPSASSATSSRNRTWWIVAGVFVVGMIALPAAIFLFTAHQISRSGLSAVVPIPSASPQTRVPSGAGTLTGQAPVPTSPISENLIVSGINENRTVVCHQNTVSISGVSNTVTITGDCTSLSVSGVQNEVTVETVDTIEASGFSNQITYRNGSPRIHQSGQGNVVHHG